MSYKVKLVGNNYNISSSRQLKMWVKGEFEKLKKYLWAKG